MRVLVTVKPQMYREALALTLHQHHPNIEVMLSPLGSLDGEAASFRPHPLVRNDTNRADIELHRYALCWIEILYTDSMDAKIHLDGKVRKIEDISTDDLLEIINEVEKLIPEESAG